MNQSNDPLQEAHDAFVHQMALEFEQQKREHPVEFWSIWFACVLFTPLIWLLERIQRIRCRLRCMLYGDAFYDPTINNGDPAFPRERGDGSYRP